MILTEAIVSRRIHITDVRLARASALDVSSGLLGWVSATVNGTLGLDGITLRRTRGGRLALSYPARRDRHGFEHPFVRPLDDATRKEIERQVLEQIAVEA